VSNIKYESEYKDNESEKIKELHDMRIFGTSKLIGIIDKIMEGQDE
jgi:hypothetical protein